MLTSLKVIEDFFRLLVDALIYYHYQFIPTPICGPILQAAISTLVLEQQKPLLATLHYLRDFLSYGSDRPASSSFDDMSHASNQPSSEEIKSIVKTLVANQGESLVQRVLTGMMFTFPRDCLQDASGVLIALFELMPEQAAMWVRNTITILPSGSIKAGEVDRVMNNIASKIQAGDLRKLRAVLQDFTTSYRRRNVAPRDGLGVLEPKRFRYAG